MQFADHPLRAVLSRTLPGGFAARFHIQEGIKRAVATLEASADLSIFPAGRSSVCFLRVGSASRRRTSTSSTGSFVTRLRVNQLPNRRLTGDLID
jgi:hypothetical protein